MQTLTKFKALLLLIPCAMLHALGMDIFVSDVPMIMRALHTDTQHVQYLLVFFMLGTGLGQPIVGVLCDKYGRRGVMLASVTLYVVASFLAVHADTVWGLTACRFLQGLGSCGTLVATYAVVNDSFSDRASYQMFSLIGCAIALAPMLAPMLGVGLTSVFGVWQACFYFLALFSFSALIISAMFLPETLPSNTVVPTVSTFLSNYQTIAKNKAFIAYTLSATIALTQLFMYFSMGSILLIDRVGISGFAFSLFFGMNAIVFICGNAASIGLQKIKSAHTIVTAGLIVMLVGSVIMLLLAKWQPLSLLGIIGSNGIMTFGVGLVMGPATGAALQPFKRLAGSASGLFATIQYCGASLLGFIASRFEIYSAMSMAVPLLVVICAGLFVLMRQSVKAEASVIAN